MSSHLGKTITTSGGKVAEGLAALGATYSIRRQAML